jgi:hypothetical protein
MSCLGRTYFVRNKDGDEWIDIGDLPEDKRKALWKRWTKRKAAIGTDVHDPRRFDAHR